MNRADAQTDRIRALYDAVAPRYDRALDLMERVLFGDGRAWVCGQAEGDVLEIAVGTGRGLGLYPAGIRLTGIDISPAMLDIARRRAASLGVDADLRVGDAQALEFADATFDSVVIALGLCTVPDDGRAVREAARVLRPGGRLVLLEHVRSAVGPVRLLQRLAEPFTSRWLGDHLLREPLGRLEAAGFVVELVLRSRAGVVERVRARRVGMDPGASAGRG
ncbi:MAG TPA: methyltransferase domain-containing protein [Candidatus Limnocylindria bacterium]|jgi:ubiquinone/menaquinone biosynthesis C-methylase UbiE